MTEARNKFLTKWGGECWHEVTARTIDYGDGSSSIVHRCKLCREYKQNCHYRTFTTPDDSAWLVKMLKEKGEWEEFIVWLGKYCLADMPYFPELTYRFANILTTPYLLADKVEEFLKSMDKG